MTTMTTTPAPTTTAEAEAGPAAPEPRAEPARERRVLGLRGRVLGAYAILLGLALALTSIVTFQQADQAQQRAVDDELLEEVVDFQAAIQAGRNDGLRPRQAVASYLDAWPEADRDTVVVRIGGDPPRAEGPLGLDPALVEVVRDVSGPGIDSVGTEAGQARVLRTLITIDGRPVGGVAAARLVQADRDALFERRAAVLLATGLAFLLASGVAWFLLGRMLRPVKDMATTADAIAREGDLTRRIGVSTRADEVGDLARTFNVMMGRLEGAFSREQRFIREASHELRTPITICRGHLEVLGDDPDPEDVRDAISVVIEELARMGRIVEDMTLLSRMEDPGFLRMEPVALGAFVADVGRAVEPLLGGRLRVSPPPPDAAVDADPQRLTQAVINLLQNAALHSGGDAPVDLRVVRRPGAWRIEVADSGGGIPAGEEERLFRPFNRGRTSSPGSGLGLAIVRGVAEAHGGAAGVDNRPGVGATFWIEVPA
jgi:two-component system, OmpR family, sensor kinase